MRNLNWNIKGFDRDTAAKLCGDGINPLAAVLLTSREITAPDDIKQLKNPETSPYHDPYLIPDMDKAVTRIYKAVENDEYIAIYGDYDVDGMSSAAALALWLKEHKARFEIYIPDRCDEGYSLNTAAIDTLKERGADLIITVDCGIVSYGEALHAKKIGLDLIITDHHESRELIPKACAVVNPKRADSKYPYKSLAGVGVVFKLICALEPYDTNSLLINYCEQLAALGTVADVMPVTGENRKLIQAGLRRMNEEPMPGLRELINAVSAEPEIVTAATISYQLAPVLNASGRIDDPKLSVDLLLSGDSKRAKKYVAALCLLNEKRRNLEQEIYEEAQALLESSGDVPAGPIVLSKQGWNPGVAGIVASKMAERYKLPVIIISINADGDGHGSCRSAEPYLIYEAIRECEDILVRCGGHGVAAGFDIREEHIDTLRSRITAHYSKNQHTPELCIDFDAEKPERLLTLANIEALKDLEPFGRSFETPCLSIHSAKILDIAPIGGGKYTKLKIEKNTQTFECVFFAMPPEALGLKPGDMADIAFNPQINQYRSRKTVQLQLQDIRKSHAED